jgi:hypothetical protein
MKTDFAIIPTAEELATIDRDLTYPPVTTTEPKVLSREQVEQYNREGYISGITIFEPEEIAEIREYFDGLLARVLAAGGDSYSINAAHLKYGRVYDILTDERIVSRVADLVGEDVIGWGAHFFCKLPRDGKTVAWHQDVSYWPLSAAGTVTVWLAIDDADLENACMRVIPGSHLHGAIEYRSSDSGEGNVLNQTVDAIETYGEPVGCELKAGQVSMHTDLLLHGSEANVSDRRRCGLTLRYCPASMQAHLDWNHKGLVVQGSDPSGHWINPPRPIVD